MLGCLAFLRIAISRSTLILSAYVCILFLWSIFMATSSPVRMCLPSFTFPKVPFPIVSRS